jgi:DNA-binding PadR family transcriptional regulator
MKITAATTLVLRVLAHDARHGFDIIDKTSLPSGTVYPILRRLDREGYASAHWDAVTTMSVYLRLKGIAPPSSEAQ